MPLSKVVHSSKATGGKDEWATPVGLFDALDTEFGFLVDGAATADNALCTWYFGPDHPVPENRDALTRPWGTPDDPTRVWLNPPYSQAAAFVRKARAEADAGNALVVLLLAARTDVQWFHELVWDRYDNRTRPRTELRFIKGRLKFSESDQSAPFPSMIVIFRPSVAFTYKED